ncbi:HTH domain-containing protein [Arenibacter sp. GZD-96]|uniref:HTH domain-containing protein n=1 Tax=Aurantibrevibacter litoralis TaxID=3106030 RepID=UPI003A4E51D0
MVTLVAKIYSNPGIKSTELQEALNVSERTITSDINRLEDFIEYCGSKKTGGYFLKDTIKQVLDSTE